MQLLFEHAFSSFLSLSLALLLSSASPCSRLLLVASLQPDPWVLALAFPPWPCLELVMAMAFQRLAEWPSKQPTQ
jgi:hypothetical protein